MVRQQEILAAAAEVFVEKGYHGATVQEIADKVGLLKGSLYYHIQGKEQLLIKVILTAVKVLEEGLGGVVSEREMEPGEKLRKAIISHMRAYETNFQEVTVFLNEMPNLPSSVRKRVETAVKKYEAMWLSILEEGISSGQFKKDIDLRIVLNAIFGMCNWTHKWFNKKGRLSPTEIGNIYADLILRGIEAK